ncbi:MAG: sugar phosphate nucleotidyltransferase, partial [Acidimicrobiia bacterium]|nr:sugar phosphate nucleotidyltransferase [Acidimicrobiia bacterium]
TPSARGELEITDAIQKLLDDGARIHSHVIEEWWLDTGKKDDLLAANTTVLDAWCTPGIEGRVDEQSVIQGRVQIGPGTEVVNCRIRGPVVIGRDCRLVNSFIGPFTSVGDRTELVDSVVQHTVLMAGCRLQGVDRIEDSLLGCNVTVESTGFQRLMRLSLGDDSHVDV